LFICLNAGSHRSSVQSIHCHIHRHPLFPIYPLCPIGSIIVRPRTKRTQRCLDSLSVWRSSDLMRLRM
jgi:hypothetical protein